MISLPSSEGLIRCIRDARARTLALVADLEGDQWIGPQMAIVNPPLWEIGHVAWFQERWVLRHLCGRPPVIACEDGLYDSAGVHHPERWQILLPSVQKTLRFMSEVRDRVIECLEKRPVDEETAWFALLAIFHEDMHGEALLYTRQTLGYPPPDLPGAAQAAPDGGPCPGDAEIEGETFPLGAWDGSAFVFDNEKWEHPVELTPFAIARAPVTEAQFLAFVEEGGYRRRELWSDEGWTWREEQDAEHPVYWRRQDPGRWQKRWFDRWLDLSEHRPVMHVNWHEAEAFCRWAGRRLPTESEWERAACGPAECAEVKPEFPWGHDSPGQDRAHVDMRSLHCADVGAFPEGDGHSGCRQMIGNVWEWTGSTFGPYPGFAEDPYKEYSAPWFGSRKVLRGGAFCTQGRMLRNTWRNFYTPDRRDVFAGFRTVKELL